MGSFPKALLLLLPFAATPALGEEHGKPAAEHGGGGEEAKPEAQAEALEPSDHYVHRWKKMPEFVAPALSDIGGQLHVKPRDGRAQVVVFLASWCEPCQQLMEDLQRIEKRYKRLPVDVVYVFAHDTKDDALGFMKEYGLTEGILANQDALKAFHSPELPSLYVADRHGWLMTRFVKAGKPDVATLDGYLKNMTAY